MTEINDVRSERDFTKLTFSKYKKTDVIKEFIKSCKDGKHEAACYWSAELICSGFFAELWESIILYSTKYVHIGNPKLCIYLKQSIDQFKQIASNHLTNEIHLRNNFDIRRLFVEVIVVCIDSNRKHAFSENFKISNSDFNMENIGTKLKAPHVEFIKDIFREGDAKETYIALNELYYHLWETRDSINACYWIEWMIEFDVMMRKQKRKNICERREHIPVTNDEKINIIWMIWDVFTDIGKKRKHPLRSKMLDSLLHVFCLKFGKGTPRKRKYILYFVVSLFTESINYTLELVSNHEFVDRIKNKVNVIYGELKKNEIAPKTDYLLKDIKTSQQKSAEKLKIMEKYMY